MLFEQQIAYLNALPVPVLFSQPGSETIRVRHSCHVRWPDMPLV